MTSITRGLNNVTDPVRLGLEWLVRADNVDITDTGAIKRRAGYTRTLPGSITGAYTTFDFTRMFLVDGGVLKAMVAPGQTVTLATGISGEPMQWTEVNDQVFFNNGVSSGIILRDNSVLPWRWSPPGTPTLDRVTGSLTPGTYQVRCVFELADGRLTGAGPSAEIELIEGEALRITNVPQINGASTRVFIAPADHENFMDAGTSTGTMTWAGTPNDLGVDLNDTFTDPLPQGADLIQAWRGRIYAAQYFPAQASSAVWFSQPLGYHLFDLNKDFIVVPGKTLMLAPHEDALIIGTDQRIFAYNGQKLDEIAQYGVVPGWHWSTDTDADNKVSRLLFWTTRGLCSALPFANLTERQVSLAPGLSAGGTVVFADGQRRYVVALKQGGTAFNPRS